MDLGLVGTQGFAAAAAILSLPSDLDGKDQVLEGKPTRFSGSGSIKLERPDPDPVHDRASKIPKWDDDLGLGSYHNALPKHQMLSFSSSATPEFGVPDSFLSRCSVGFGCENLNGSLPGMRGAFTPAQWIELEYQAMIYKYISANVAVPSHLLIPIRKALTSSGFPAFSLGSYPTHSYGWGSFNLGFGFSGSTDPEPGRCRRTDGKKWRCSKDAVPDQKYCEKHINRGRHRSRKPVEGQSGQAASGPTTSKVVPPISAPMPSLVTSSGTDSLTNPMINRLYDLQSLSMMHPNCSLKSKGSPFSILKQNIPMDESLQSEFGLVSNDSLLNPSEKRCYSSGKSYNSFTEFDAQQVQDQGPPKPLMVDWPKEQSNRSAIPWPGEPKSDWTQLSMSIPMPSDFSSSSSSPNKDSVALSPVKLSRHLDPSQMGVGVGTVIDETGAKTNAWIPVAWENSMGGPLGEALNNASNAMGGSKSKGGSHQLASSPTGVLQKGTIVSL